MMEKLCDDITIEILIRLPSKSIVQLRCVCKRWNTLVREANFIKSHLRRSINNNDKDEILLVYNRWLTFRAHSSASPDIELINFIKLPVNFPSEEVQRNEIFVIGSANGLICFHVGDYDDNDDIDNIVIHVWNPSLSMLLTVPPYASTPVRSNPNSLYWYYFGFGFDPKNDDYKIVKIIKVDHKESVEWLQVEVYSMRSGYWKLITQSPFSHYQYLRNDRIIHVNADGYFHWLCGSDYDDLRDIQCIVAFDLAAESFSEISLPDPMNAVGDHSRGRVELGVFGGELCVISCAGACEVWVMDPNGSWVKNGFSHFHKDDIYPYGFTLKNNFIYKDCKEDIHLYHLSAPFNKVKPFQNTIHQRCVGDKVIHRIAGETIIIPYVKVLFGSHLQPAKMSFSTTTHAGRLLIASFC